MVELDGVSLLVALATFCGSISCLLLCVYAWGQRTIPGQREFSLLCLSVSIWCGFATAEYLSMEENRRLVFGALTHLGSRILEVFPDCPPRLIQPGNSSTRQEVNRADGQGHEEYRSMALRSTHGTVIGRQVLIRDITEHRKHTSYLLDLANRDPLTSLLNRRGSFAELNRRTLDQDFFTLVFVDLNDFKRVNDEYGHHTEDQVLIEVGRRLDEALAGGGVVGRIGGDEFALVLDRESRATGLRLFERIEQAMEKPIAVDTHMLNVSASIGLACFPEDCEDCEDSESLMSNADKRMYWIKRQRRSSRSRL